MTTLEQFYALLDETHRWRLAAVSSALEGRRLGEYLRPLTEAAAWIDRLPGTGVEKHIEAGRHQVTVRLDYEASELARDILFIRDGSQALEERLAEDESSFHTQARRAAAFIAEFGPELLITDRDGTINRYCGRYRSSHQSIYNALYLSRFAQQCVHETLILTSAPLFGDGLLCMTAMPDGLVHYAGSKGREYLRKDGRTGSGLIAPEQQRALDDLNRRLEALLAKERYRPFGLIGSGFQRKHGQTTVAHQDVHGSIPDDESAAFRGTVEDLVGEIDPERTVFRTEDTGTDLEIILTVDRARDFDKGDGVAFLDTELELTLADSRSLICGDTSSDLPMVERAFTAAGPERIATIFVTGDTELAERLTALGVRHLVVSSPDVLITAFSLVATG